MVKVFPPHHKLCLLPSINLSYVDVGSLEYKIARCSCDLQEIELILDNQKFSRFREGKEI